MMWYLLYAKAGREFECADAIRDLGLEAICEPRMIFKRSGKKRRPEAEDVPYLPNFIFAQIPAAQFLDVIAIKFLASTAIPVPKRDWSGWTDVEGRRYPGIHDFVQAARAEYRDRQRVKDNQQALCEYTPGEAVRLLDGKFSDRALTFRAMVERPHDTFPKVQMETEMMGRQVLVEADPLNVGRAG